MQRIGLFLTTIFFSTALWVQPEGFEMWDKDGDGVIERQEFVEKFTKDYFSAWDPTNTQGIIEEGFFKKTYAGLDSDNDNLLSDEEWLIGYNYFYDDYLAYGDIGFIDVNADGTVRYEAYDNALYDTNYFTDVDLDEDNSLSEYELADYVFDNWDFDESKTLSEFEYKGFSRYYIDV
jgi:hypothetical protein